MGIIERDGNDINCIFYCINLFFFLEGKLIGKYRKFKFIGIERCIWGEGDGSIFIVVDILYGKMGLLICWENYMLLVRIVFYVKGVKFYIVFIVDLREEW